MRGEDAKQAAMVCLISPCQVVPLDHTLRRIKRLADGTLKGLSPLFDQRCSVEWVALRFLWRGFYK